MNEDNKKTIRKAINMSPRQMRMVEDIQALLGFTDFADVMRDALAYRYTKLFPAHATKTNGSGSRQINPIDAARRQMEMKKEKERLAEESIIEEKSKICRFDLKGRVATDSSGNKFCLYATSDPVNSYIQKLPIKMVFKEYASTIHSPSIESIKANRPDFEKEIEELYDKEESQL